MAYKVFQNGFPLNASELNNYLMNQSVMVFATATARDADLTAPTEGMIVWLQDANKFVYYTGTAWADVVTGNGTNAIINGAFDFWQRGNSFTPTAANFVYTADRWDSARESGTSGSTVTRQTAGLTGFTYALRHQRNSGDTSTTNLWTIQRLDTATSVQFQNQTVTLSFYARAGANFSAASSQLKVMFYTGTGTDQGGYPSAWTGSSTLSNAGYTLTTSWQRFTVSVAIGSTATQIGWLTGFAGVGTAGAADYFEITGVQLEAGSVATPFKRNANSLQGELAACYRYYQPFGYGVTALNQSTTKQMINGTYGVTMRTTPTLTLTNTSGTFFEAGVGTRTFTISSISPNTTEYGFIIEPTTTSSGVSTVKQIAWLSQNFAASAEL